MEKGIASDCNKGGVEVIALIWRKCFPMMLSVVSLVPIIRSSLPLATRVLKTYARVRVQTYFTNYLK